MVKSIKKTRQSKKSRTMKRRRQNMRKTRHYKKGGCGCNGSKEFSLLPFAGGDSIASYNTDLPYSSYYQQNSLINDPTSAGVIINSRNLPNMSSTLGGKKNNKRVRKSRKYKKHISGGGVSDLFLGSNPQNAFLSAATSPGILDSYNTVRMANDINPAPYIQPVLSMYGDHNLPLV